MPKHRVYEYCYLHKVAKHSLDEADQSEEGRFYHLITCLGFCAFLLESVMNEIGDALFTEWMSEHEWKGPKDKRDLIRDHLTRQVDHAQRPFQTFHKVFAVRSLIVHAKPQKLNGLGPKGDSLAGKLRLPGTELEEIATPENVRRIFEDTEAMIKEWAAALPPETHRGLQNKLGPFKLHGHGWGRGVDPEV